ncbi:MAG: tyrosine-type recombinase/integrase, partial [Flavisolibacter sp.]|nr:tyrosine-type recombinase/integrase [Flavisolibacter sp.]
VCVPCSILHFKLQDHGKKTLSAQAVAALQKTAQYLSLGHYSVSTIRNYLSELRYLFVYYPDIELQHYTEEMMIRYLLYVNKTLNCSRVKCRMAAQSIAFFFRHVLKQSYVVPSMLYPRPCTKLPPVMCKEEVLRLIDSVENVKHRCIIMLLYSSGLRLSETSALRITDIHSKQMLIKVVQGKGAKDRYTVLSQQALLELRAYYLIYRPVEYLFNGQQKGSPMSHRSIQSAVQKALIQLGLQSKNYRVHTLHHSFATHLLQRGTDLHTIKELLAHSSLSTTLQYLHLTTAHLKTVVNPYDEGLKTKGRPCSKPSKIAAPEK